MDLSPRIALLAGFALLSACGVSAEEHQEAQKDAARAMSAYRDLAAKTEAVDSAVADLRGQVDRLDSEDWQVVVPDLKAAVDRLESDQADANDAAGL